MRRALLAVTFAALLTTTAALGGAAGRATLPLTVNHVEQGDVKALVEGDDVLVRVEDLTRAGLASLSGERRVVEDDEYVSLRSLAPRVVFSFDRSELTLDVTAEPGLFGKSGRAVGSARPAGILYTKDTSLFLNYAATGTWADSSGSKRSVSGFAETGLSLRGALLYSSATRLPDGSLLRGMSNVTWDDRDRLVRWVAGDTFSPGGGLAGSTFLAGVSVSRNFEADPYFYRFPGIGVSGAVTTPSKADVYVNGSLVKSIDLPPGSFDLSSIPAVAGAGSAQVVLRDAFGQERVLDSTYYLSTRILAPGLSEYRYDLGFERRDVSTSSFSYGGPVFLATHRLGLTRSLTGGLHFEAARGLVSGGATAAASFAFGEVEAMGAVSRDSSRTGWAGSLAYTWRARRFGVGALVRLRSDSYANVSARAEHDRARVEASAFAAVPLGRRAALSVAYTRQDLRDAGLSERVDATLSASLSPRFSAYARGGRVRLPSSPAVATEASVGVSLYLGGTATASVSYQRDGDVATGRFDVQRSLPRGEGFGFRVHSDTGSGSTNASARVQYQGAYGLYEASYDRMNGSGGGTLSVSGGVVALGGTVALSRAVRNGFALLRVPGVEGVRALASNQEVGKTNAKGDLLVPDLLPYYGNVLGIADDDVPLDYEIGATKLLVAPPYRGGALVAFPVKKIHAFRGVVLLSVEGRDVVPAFGLLRVVTSEGAFESPLDARGAYFLASLPPGQHPAEILYKGEVCKLSLSVPVTVDPVVTLGTARCVLAPGLLVKAPEKKRPEAPSRPEASAPSANAPGTPAAVPVALKAPVEGFVFAIHLSSYQKRENAERDARRLAGETGHEGHVVAVDLGAKGTWYRALVGEFDAVGPARLFREELIRRGFKDVGPVYRVASES